MKKEHFRNAGIGERLNGAAREWESSAPGHCFHLAIRRISKSVSSALWTLLYIVVAALFLAGHERGDVFLALFLPVIAAMTLSELNDIANRPLLEEATYLLPFSTSRLDRQIHSDWKSPLCNGLLASAFLGSATGASGPFLASAFVSMVIFAALLGLLSISYLPRFRWTYQISLFGFAALTFFGFISSTILKAVTPIVHWLPWHAALTSPGIVLACFLAGGATVVATRKLWSTIGPFPRDRFYEDWDEQGGYEELFVAHEDLPDDVFETPPEPRGLVESLLWNNRSAKEKSILKIAGITQTNWLRDWLTATLIGLGLIWLTRQEWLIPPNAMKPVSTVVFVGAIFHFLFRCTFHTGHFNSAQEIGPHTQSCPYQTFPIGLPTLEKLCLREVLFKAPFIAISAAAASILVFPTLRAQTPTGFLFASLNFLPIVILITLSSFWHNSYAEWLPKSNRHTLFFRLADGLILLIAAFSIFAALAGLAPTEGRILVTSLKPALLLTLIGLPFILILRTMVRSYFSGASGDLMKVEENPQV
ncbi:MAG: hypothetical protein ACON38_11830 [Akkermansiaceae bacterium]